MSGEILPLLMAAALCIGIFSGYPVGFVLGGLGVAFVYIGGLSPGVLQLAASRVFGLLSNWLLLSIPLFIFMGLMLDRSGVAARFLKTLERAFGQLRGGLAISVALLGIVMAASTGIVGASVVTLGLLALPVMLRQGYDPRIATGIVAASGTLGILIPPSIMLVVIGAMLQIPVGDLFRGALLPGLLLGLAYVGFIVVLGLVRPAMMPPAAERASQRLWPLLYDILRSAAGPVFLIAAVLGSILGGIATPTEAAGVGAAGATVLAVLSRQLSLRSLAAVVAETGKVSGMIMLVSIGATVFSGVFKSLGGNDMIADAVSGTGLGAYGVLCLFMLVLFLAGFFLEWIEITFIMLPILAPIAGDLDFGLGLGATQQSVWFAILVAINLQTSFLTPPFGFALFYVRGVAPPDVSLSTIYRGAMPFVGVQLIVLVLAILFPPLVLALVT